MGSPGPVGQEQEVRARRVGQEIEESKDTGGGIRTGTLAVASDHLASWTMNPMKYSSVSTAVVISSCWAKQSSSWVG